MTLHNYLIVVILVVTQSLAFSQNASDTYLDQIQSFQNELNEKFSNPETS